MGDNIFKYDDLDESSWGTPFFNKLMYYGHVFSEETIDDIKGSTLAKKVFGETLEPSKPITREEAVALMTVFLDKEELTKESKVFTDTVDSAFKEDIETFCKTGIINGYPDGTFKPKNNITRAEASVIIGNLYENDRFIKDITWGNGTTFLDPDVVRVDPEDNVYQVLLNESRGDYAKAHQYLSGEYKAQYGIYNPNYFFKNKESHIMPEEFVFDKNAVDISAKGEKNDNVTVEFKSKDSEKIYQLELVLVGLDDWYINSKNY